MSREILNFDAMKECLEDPGLLALGVLIPVTPDHDDLAVPVGGKRRGGEIGVLDAEGGRVAMAMLANLPGFPNLRYVPTGEDKEAPGCVRWGEPEPAWPGVGCGNGSWLDTISRADDTTAIPRE